ncbi:hypothetical protein HOD75_04490 [archaeon]|jgi:small subunit ribosomal protein S4e|nr:hypothetical protein [archaeon]MBT4242123.1 hypothetical protein [archaeon]MBT4417811.1 hypothetical protein [archaeon]
MAYLKRSNIPKFWPVHRKGTKYLSLVKHDKKTSIPLVVAMREILGLVGTKKELKTLINEKQILINQKKVKETNYPLNLFDVLTLVNLKKNYRVFLSEHKKMIFKEISGKDAETRLFKIKGRKILSKNKVQLNLMQGMNILSEEKGKSGDSVLLDLKKRKIMKIIPMEKGKTALVIKGKHAGIVEKIDEIVERGGKRIAVMRHEGEKVNVWTKNIVVSENGK